MKTLTILAAMAPTPTALEYPECTPNTLMCFRYEAFRVHGPFDYIGALQAGLERTATPRPTGG